MTIIQIEKSQYTKQLMKISWASLTNTLTWCHPHKIDYPQILLLQLKKLLLRELVQHTTLQFNSAQQQHCPTQVPTCQSYHKFFDYLPQKSKLLKSNTCTVMSASCAGLDSIEKCYLTFKLENKYFMDIFIVLWDLWRDIILGWNWQLNYKMGCNFNINRHQYMTHNNNYLFTSIPSKVSKPIAHNAWVFYLQPRSVSIITVKAPIELKPQHTYKLSTSDDLSLGLIPLEVNHGINYKYPKLLCIPIFNMAYSRVFVPRSTVFGMLKPSEIENAEGSSR